MVQPGMYSMIFAKDPSHLTQMRYNRNNPLYTNLIECARGLQSIFFTGLMSVGE